MNRRLWLMLIFLFLIPLAGFLTITYFVTTGKILPLDQFILNLIKPLESVFLTKYMSFLSHLGSTGPVIVLSCMFVIVIYLLYRKVDEVILFVVVLLGSTGMNQALKFLFKRERPFEQIVAETGFSYPSGHTMAAVSLYGVIAFLVWRHIPTVGGRTLLILFSSFMIMFIGFSRVYLRVHYPSDVVGAFLLSGIWLYITLWIYQYVMEKRYEKESVVRQ